MAYSRVWLDDLVDRTDIVQIVSRHVQLTKRGNRYWGLCPFHMEKTASFSVNPQMQMYYCFGCHASGGAINFLMEIEHLEFKEAVTQLAEEAHVPLPENFNRERDNSVSKGERDRIYELNKAYARYLHSQLWEPQNAAVLSYFHNRALNDRTIRKFGLGASPLGGDTGTRAMRQLGFTDKELVQAGISLNRDGRVFDMFRGRAMFPIINARGQVLGFGGRALDKDPRKYMNTGDTLVFNKRQEVFAANLLKKARGLKRIILTEGYMDVISLIQAGVEGVVATLGTALTIEQARLLKRYAPEIWVSYDGDSAGQHAILRALDIFEAEHVPVRVLDFPNGMDPDEYVRAYGAQGLDTLAPESAVVYRMLREAEKHDMSTKEGRTEYAIACSKFLANVTEPVELENYVQRLIIETGFSREVLLAQIGRTETMTTERQAVYRRAARPLEARAQGTDIGTDAAEKQLLTYLASGIGRDHIQLDDFMSPENRQFAEMLLSGKNAAMLLEEIEDEGQRSRFARILDSSPDATEDEQMQAINDCLAVLRRKKHDKRVELMKEQISSLSGEAKEAALRRMQEMIINSDSGKEG
ncbi:MAG: DNA primase [Clostridia bacterium]|nr:DNA primase [Clostridia bacterium]